MAKKSTSEVIEEPKTSNPNPNQTEWTEYVLSLLTEDEKVSGNPTTDGLRRIFEIALNCVIMESTTNIVQAPDISNEKRATAIHNITYLVNDDKTPELSRLRTVSGSADVYWGNCDKIYRNHPVAVAETRAEGRALRRALKLRKVVAAEEIAKDIEDDIDGVSVSKITNNQINFIDVLSKRLDVDVIKLLADMSIETKNIHTISHEKAVEIVQKLSEFQQNSSDVPDNIKPYNPSWK